jgi:hypothetical protein
MLLNFLTLLLGQPLEFLRGTDQLLSRSFVSRGRRSKMGKKSKAIPKRVAGVKVPKTLRRSKTLRTLLSSPLGRNMLANALTAGAGAAAAVLIEERQEIVDAGKQGLKKGGRTIGRASEAVQSGTSAAMEVIGDAAHSMLPKEVRKGKKFDAGKGAVRH